MTRSHSSTIAHRAIVAVGLGAACASPLVACSRASQLSSDATARKDVAPVHSQASSFARSTSARGGEPEICASGRRLVGPPGTDPLTAAREDVAAFYAGDTAALWSHAGVRLRGRLVSAERFADFSFRTREELGALRTAVSECAVPEAGGWVYERVDRYAGTEQPIVTHVSFTGDRAIDTFSVARAVAPYPTPFDDYLTRTALRLPFDGEWTVAWGGRDTLENHHVAKRGERYAYDFIPPAPGLGTPILAPADASVVEVEDDVADHPTGGDDAPAGFGNHVLLDLGSGEIAMLAHMQLGSVRPHAGDRVRRGDVLGACGNSGHSTEPHLHFHLQNDPRTEDARGLPAQFESYRADGASVARGEPLRAQRIEAIATASDTTP